mgnify:CR=1 FL=1
MHVTGKTAKAIENGEYGAWDCLNRHYEKESHSVSLAPDGKTGRVHLELEGIYDLDKLIPAYSKLPGLLEGKDQPVQLAPGITNGGASSDVCLKIAGSKHKYVFYAVRLPESRYIYVESPADGKPELKDTWTKPSNEPKPDWIADVCY